MVRSCTSLSLITENPISLTRYNSFKNLTLKIVTCQDPYTVESYASKYGFLPISEKVYVNLDGRILTLTENGGLLCTQEASSSITIDGTIDLDQLFFIARGIPSCEGCKIQNVCTEDLHDRNSGEVIGFQHGERLLHKKCSGFSTENANACRACFSLSETLRKRKMRIKNEVR